MAIKVWQSTTGSLTDASSWGGTALAAGDTGFFKGSNTTPVTSGLALGAATANLVTYPEYSGDIGSPGAGMTHDTALGKHIHRGTGTFYYGTSVASSVSQAQFIVDAPLTGKEAAVLNGILADTYVKSGRVTLGPNYEAIAPGGFSRSIVVYGDDARLVIEPRSASQASADEFRIHAGQVEDKRGFFASTSKLVIRGGTMRETGLLFGTMKVYIYGGTLIYNPATSPSGETPDFYVEGGTLDVRESEFVIPVGQVVKGPNGTILGNAVDIATDFTGIDLSQDYP